MIKKLLYVIAIAALLANPLFAQDDGGGGGGLLGADGGGFFGGDGGGDNGGGGNGGGRNAQPVDRLVALRNMLAQANTPLTKDQEKTLSTMLETEINKYVAELEKKYPEEAAAARTAGQRGEAQRGGRGGGGGRGAGGGQFGGRGEVARRIPVVDTPMTAEMRRMNGELQAKVTASLKPEQQAVVDKFLKNQIRARGGLDALKLTMEEAGAPLTAEQTPQIQALYEEQNQARIQMLRESQGQPDAAKLSQLELQTMTKVLRVLNAAQRKALQDSMAKAKPQP